jgi:hypothetical protein
MTEFLVEILVVFQAESIGKVLVLFSSERGKKHRHILRYSEHF